MNLVKKDHTCSQDFNFIKRQIYSEENKNYCIGCGKKVDKKSRPTATYCCDNCKNMYKVRRIQ